MTERTCVITEGDKREKMGKANGKRIDWLDISKGIAIIMVVVGHISSLPWEPYRKIIFSVHMPLFFIVIPLNIRPSF